AHLTVTRNPQDQTGHCQPYTLGSGASIQAGSILMSIGTSLIEFQILCGVGNGFGEEQGIDMVQTILPGRDIAIGVSIVFFA
ncbi:uncharacterized protein N7500_004471, partial [Penicillium coprophilum]|uniref:uncharacterized protein n=1 Tax=Penicillium coprophilum TaxID=36646 RepID=UPI0023A34C5B